jgi:hypothetical protein
MAILGGGIGGAGNPIGGSFTGPAEALDVYGDFAAAYSGQQNINTAAVQHLKFVTGNYLFVGNIQFNGPCKVAASGDLAGGDIAGMEVSFNDVSLFQMKVDTASENMPTEITAPFLIPAYTEVLVEVISTGTTAGFLTSVNIIGRIYRD